MATESERNLENTTEELDDRLGALENHIEEAEEKAPNATLDESGGNAAGDWEDSDDATGGEDPEGAARRDEQE